MCFLFRCLVDAVMHLKVPAHMFSIVPEADREHIYIYIYITASLARKAANTYDTLCWWIVNYADHLFRAELSLKNKLTILPIQVTLCLLNWILNGTQNCCVCQEKTHRL